ncbi:YceD family protein, partial [Pseudomonas aeruginosa]
MVNGLIPSHIDLHKLVDLGATLEGVYALADMPRVCEQLTSDAGEVRVKVSFERDHQKLAVMHMQLYTEVSTVCQRCLDAAAIPVHGEYTYAILREGQSSDGLPNGYDSLEVWEE